jgi:pimeloyl-ACP methyl ester carboxylesterase
VDHRFVDVDGIKIRYVIKGSKDKELPIFLVHGWGCSIKVVMSLIDQLSRSHQVIALDLPGHGESQRPSEIWGTAEFAAFLSKFLHSIGIERCHGLGHSVGGRFLACLAAKEPSLLDKLILAGASGIKPKRKLKYYFKVSLAKTGKFAAKYLGTVGQKLKDKIYSKIASADYQSAGELRSSFIKIVNEDIRSEFEKIKSDTLLIWGENDQDSPIASAEIFKRQIPKSQLVILKNAGHYSFLDQPERFSLEVKKFLRE